MFYRALAFLPLTQQFRVITECHEGVVLLHDLSFTQLAVVQSLLVLQTFLLLRQVHALLFPACIRERYDEVLTSIAASLNA